MLCRGRAVYGKIPGGRTAPAFPFGYRAGDSPLHRCPAPIKLLAVLLLSIFAYGSVPGLCAGALGIAAAALVAGIRPWELLRGSRPVLFLALLFFLLRIIEFGGTAPFFRVRGAEIPGGLAQGLSMLVSFAGGALLFAVTTMGELRAGRPFSAPPLSRFGLALSLMLGFFPRFFEIWEGTTLAWRARGGSPGRIGALILPVTERMLESAFNTAEALEARGLTDPRDHCSGRV
ncbi:MAG: energy-coupling factor transporter transmembrane protein EcfT [Treponema sp.]|jgi:biotin transport system permease protein|nr:energy-coupling factor transporter transmembrane protein EcfT [Treponema sp.]